MLGSAEFLIVLVVVVLVFGGTQLPKLARSLRESQNILRVESKE